MVSQILTPRCYSRIQAFLNARKSVLVLGPRGTGKTSFLTEVVGSVGGHVIAIDLLNKRLFDRYLRRPEFLTEEVESSLKGADQVTVFIDEVQKLPFLLDEVHRLLECYKPRLTFLLTGSSARKLKRHDANLLAGRALSVDFYPLGIDEFDYHQHEFKALEYGTLPEVFFEENEELRREFLLTYVGTYLDEEIQREADVRNLPGFAQFLELVAAENGAPVNYRNIARAAHISDVTVKDYYTLLVDTLVAYRIPAWSHSAKARLTQSPRYFVFDNGVINALTGEFTAELRPSTGRFGKLFENFVVTQLIQQLNKSRSPLKMYHYREKEGREIDLILQKNPYSPPIAIEIKSATDPTVDTVKQLRSFRADYPEATCMVICRTPRSYVSEGIEFYSLPEAVRVLGGMGHG